MAFTTVQGSGTNDATSYVGTSGIDSLTLINQEDTFFVGAQQEADFVGYTTTTGNAAVLQNGEIRLGSGGDSFTDLGNGLANGVVLLTSTSVNGNKDADILGAAGAGITGTNSSVWGGQGDDTINLANISGGFVNGNKDADTINTNGVTYVSTSLFGGQGADTITISGGETFTATTISGDNDNDTITVAAGVTAFTSTTLAGGQGNDTVSIANAGVAGYLTGGEGTDTLTGDAGADTIEGGAGNDTVTGGAQADSLTVGAGINHSVQLDGQSVAYTAFNLTNGGFVAGETAVFANGVDVIEDFTAATVIFDSTPTVNWDGYLIAGTTVDNSQNAIRGTWASATSTFSYNIAGNDALVLFAENIDAETAINSDNYVVAVGAAGSITAANFV